MDGQGYAYGYLNTGRGSNSWDNRGVIVSTGGPINLHQIRWAPVTNSGRADIIVVDDADGACAWAENQDQQAGGTYQFGVFNVLATGPRHSVVAAPYSWVWDPRRVQFAE
jgi:hypothetical protein